MITSVLILAITVGASEVCLKIGSLAQTADARMFELPATGNCGQYVDTGDVLCIGNNSLKIVRKWGLAVQLEGSHGAKVDDEFTIGNCEHEQKRHIMKIESISTAVSLAYDFLKQKISALLVSPESGEGRILSMSTVISDSRISVLPLESGNVRDIAILRDGNFLICDTMNHRVLAMIGNHVDVVAGNGVTTTALSPDGGRKLSEFKFPTAVAVASLGGSTRRYDAVFVVDAGNFRVVRWRLAALRGEVVWEAEIGERSEITGFGKIAVGNFCVKFVLKKKFGDVLVTLSGNSLMPHEEISDTPPLLWTVDEGKTSDNIYLQSEISRREFPGVHDLVLSQNFVSSRAAATTWKSEGEQISDIRGFVALAEDGLGGLFGINEDGVVWNKIPGGLVTSNRSTSSPLIRDEL